MAHLNDLPAKFSVCVNEGQGKLPTLYWLPKLHKRPYKARFIANSSSCTTTELSKFPFSVNSNYSLPVLLLSNLMS